MLKNEGDTLLKEATERNLKTAESIGFEKSRKALQEIADTLEEADNYQPLLDRAYEIGYKPSWDGTVDFALKDSPLGVILEGIPTESLTDVTQALSDEEAVQEGYLDESALVLPDNVDEYDIHEINGGADDRADSVAPTSSWLQTTPGGGIPQVHYRWVNNAGNVVRGWAVLGGRPTTDRPVFRHIYIRRYNYRLNSSGILTAYESRARSRYILADGGTHYSQFRQATTAGYQIHTFNQSVTGVAAEMWRSSWRVL